MSVSEDISNLFGKFEGQARLYQEVSRENQAVQALTRWPLLSSIALDESARVPDVGEPVAPATSATGLRRAPQVSREAAPAFSVQSGPARTVAAESAAGSRPEAGRPLE